MSKRHQGDTKIFRELDFAEQAKSITAAINNLRAAIKDHVAQTPDRSTTIEKCLLQVDQLGQRLRETYMPQGSFSDSTPGRNRAAEVSRFQVASPRLANPEQAADFAMDVAEESHDAGL